MLLRLILTDITNDEIHNEQNAIDHSLLTTIIFFSILSTKSQSINANIDQLRIFVDKLKTLAHEFSAICNH